MASIYKHKDTNKKYRLAPYHDGEQLWLVGFVVNASHEVVKPTGYPRHFKPTEVEEVKSIHA